MKKVIFGALATVLMVSASAQAMEMPVLVSLDSAAGAGKGASARFFYEITKDTDLVVGWDGSIPLESGTEIGFNAKVGLATELPLIGRTTLTTDIAKATATSSPWLIGQNVWLGKDFLYNLTDQVKIGLTINMINIKTTAGAKAIEFHPSVYPVIGATVSLM